MTTKPKAPSFDVATNWPLDRIPSKARQNAIQELVANHTLIVGQSRSGKTMAARRLIEEIIAWTDTRVVILDPNADFTLLNKLSDVPERAALVKEFREPWRKVAKEIVVATPGSNFGIDWGELELADMAAFLRLNPASTFAEYRHLDRHFKFEKETKGRIGSLKDFLDSKYFGIAVGEDLEKYKLRIEELLRLKVWADGGKKNLKSLFAKNPKAVVVDLSSDEEQERMITAERTLEALWREGDECRKKFLMDRNFTWPGTLVVIDEGHVFAPPFTDDPQRLLVSERIQRSADSGKKLNLYLLIITQQPSKLHPSVLSEFNNRIIMRVNERGSLASLENTYGGSRGRYDGALTFKKGEALIEGALLCDETPPPVLPRGIMFQLARTAEGGGTPKTDWALPRG